MVTEKRLLRSKTKSRTASCRFDALIVICVAVFPLLAHVERGNRMVVPSHTLNVLRGSMLVSCSHASMSRHHTPHHNIRIPSTLLLRHTDSSTPTTGRLGVLTTHTQAPVVSQTPMRTDLLQALQVITQFRVDTVRQNLLVLAIHNIALSVEEP